MQKIIVELSGGLGNQLFQVSAADWLKELGYDVSLDPIQNEINGARENNVRELAVELGIHYVGHSKFGLSIARTPILRRIYSMHLKRMTTYELENFQTPSSVINETTRRLSGYWQTSTTTNRIKFLLDSSVGASRMDNALAIHVRRGDYLHPQHSVHGALDGNYFLNAIASLEDQNPERQVVLFTDSPEILRTEKWVKEIPFKNIIIDPGQNPFATLLEMAKFNSIICSNSTYSWWAAHIGKNKEIMFPDKWFRETPLPPNLLLDNAKVISAIFK